MVQHKIMKMGASNENQTRYSCNGLCLLKPNVLKCPPLMANKFAADITWNNSYYQQQPTITSRSIQLSTMHQPWGRTKKQKKNGCYSHFVVHPLLSACNVLQSLVWSYCLLIFLWVGLGCLFPLHSPLISSSWHRGMGFLIQVLKHSGADFMTFTSESFLVESDEFGSESKLSTSIDSLGASNVTISSLSEDECKVFLWYIRVEDA